MLVTVTLPERLPVVAGSKVTLKEVDCPAARVSGSEQPDRAKPAPVSVICERVTLALPVFARVTVCVVLVPVVMLPKLNEDGVGVICRVGEMPVPARATTRGEVGELFTNVRLPEKVLAEAGAKPMVKTEEAPGATVSGTVRPAKVKPVPASAAWVTLRFALPAFWIVRDWVLVVPTVTLLKLTLAGMTEICG